MRLFMPRRLLLVVRILHSGICNAANGMAVAWLEEAIVVDGLGRVFSRLCVGFCARLFVHNVEICTVEW